MSCLRRNRFLTVLLALCSLLFMQFAVASYACPGFEARVQMISAMAQAGLPCAQEMSMAPDEDQPNLCSAHCQPAQPGGGDHALQVPVALIDHRAFFAAPAAIVFAERMTPRGSLLAQATAPPLAIRNCCWRI
jgi:hypothetical protein